MRHRTPDRWESLFRAVETTVQRVAKNRVPANARVHREHCALLVLCVVLSATFAGCLTRRVTHSPAPPISVPDAYAETPVSGEAVDGWCSEFQSDALDELVMRGLSDNLRMTAAFWRVEQAQAAFRQARATRMPTLGAEFGASYQQQYNAGFEDISFPGPPGAESGGGIDPTFQFDSYSLSARAQYEIDVWGRRASQAEAARLDAIAARDDAESLALTLTAQIAETWFSYSAQHENLALIDKQLNLNHQTLELLNLRFEQGLSPISPVLQQRQQLASLQASHEQAVTELSITRNQIALLLGVVPSDLVLPEDARLPALPPALAVGVPADLLTSRPDVRAAQRRVEAADYRVSEAIAARLPTLSIAGNVGFSSGKFTELFQNVVYGIMGSATASLLDGGSGRARVDSARAGTYAALADFGQAMLTAIGEVEDALVREQRQGAYIDALQRQLDAAHATLESTRSRYQQGEQDTNFLDVLAPQQTIESIERSLIAARRAQLSYRVQLCRAVGGAWTSEIVRERELLLESTEDTHE